MGLPPTTRVVVRILLATVVLMLTSTSMASARVFHCASGDVFCLIGSIRSANEHPGSHQIFLEAGTYPLTVVDNMVDGDSIGGNGLPSITGRLTIEGAGPEETIIQARCAVVGPSCRIFHVAATGQLTLWGVTIRDGSARSGGGIFNRGTLTISDSVIRNNVANFGEGGGIQNLARLKIIDSRITDTFSGSGIASRGGSLEILRSTIDHNNGLPAGGIVASGTTIIEDSTINDNFGFEAGTGGLAVGGITTIRNTTIARNTAREASGGGLTVGGSLVGGSGGTVHLINVTVADNRADPARITPGGGGGVNVTPGATVLLQNTIVARNTACSFSGCGTILASDCLGSVTSLGNNIIGVTADCTVDLLSTDHVADAGLGVFVDDETPGGGHIPLLAESPAIDAGNRAACPRRDQLGQRRVDGDGDHRKFCDIGAVEFIP
jgi:hypothetical protein